MSAYALPGLFPPLPKQYDYASVQSPDCCAANESESREDSCVAASSEDQSAERVGICVKEAKIDSALLVQSLDKCTITNSPRARRKRVGNDSTKGESDPSNSQDEAMQFELLISFGGRKYNTTRSWPSICQFRKDLIRNLRSCEIPELPSLHPPGVLCKSFSFLHNLVSSYVPTLEGWLKTVTALVPHDNPILSHFLDESKADAEEAKNWLVQEMEKRSSCSQFLDAIEESESEEEDDDDHSLS